ncbi:hypothetical protein GCM10027430_05350 [Lysobacter tyrosinilyticus]
MYEADATVAVEFNGTTDWAKPGLDPLNPPILRIPRSYLSPAAIEAVRDDRLIARNIELAIPFERSGFANTEHELTQDVLIVTLAESADGWAERSQRALKYVQQLQGTSHDPEAGLDRVVIDDSPGISIRHRYIHPSGRDDEFVQLDCVSFDDPATQDTCRLEIMPVRNVLASIHFKASGVHQWQQRATELRRLVSSWQ